MVTQSKDVDLTGAVWRKSSQGDGDDSCVEVAHVNGHYAVRNAADPEGGILVFTPGEWDAFRDGVSNGEFD